MGLFDEIDSLLDESNNFFYGKMDEYDKAVIKDIKKKLERDGVNPNILDFTQFKDANFMHELYHKVDEEDIYKYALNTCKKKSNMPCDNNYVLVSRRAIPSEEPKPESFWTLEHSQAVQGLRKELPDESPLRLHSVIMISTLGRLEKHGLAETTNGVSDGEVCIDPNKPFNDFLFMYKSEEETKKLRSYLKNGGMTREETLVKLKETANERKIKQGFKNR